MPVDEDFYQQLEEALPTGAVAIATVADSRGSVPREVGAKLALAADGRCWGTIGGGAGEALVLAGARQVLATGEPQSVEIDLSGASERPTQGVCGGRMRVWLARWVGAEALALVRQIRDRWQQGRTATLVTPWAPAAAPYLLAASDPPPTAAIALVETLRPPPTLLIVGAGHVAVPLASAAALAGFRVTVQDDRAEFAQPERFPAAVQVLAAPTAAAIAALTDTEQLYAALVTRGVACDRDALLALLGRSPACCYLGAIGSRQRVQVVKRALSEAGIPAAQLAQLRAPIGLDLGALTPGEIAISIVAELVQVRRGGGGLPLSQRPPAQTRASLDRIANSG